MRRFVIRDIETKKIRTINGMLLDFNSFEAAKTYLSSLQFGLGNYYEIYDTKYKIIAFKYIMNVDDRKKIGKISI